MRERQRLRLADAGADDDQLLHAIDAPQELGGARSSASSAVSGFGGLGAGPLVGAVARALDQAELLDVARDRRLRRVEAALLQPAAQLLLAVQRFAVDEFEDERPGGALS